MDLLNIDKIKVLLKSHQKPCLSIFMPTHRKGKEIEQDPIRFRNLLHKGEKDLAELGLRSSEIKNLREPAVQLLDDPFFWRHQVDGLAVFATTDEFYYYRLPANFKELSVVSNRFYIKPLLPLLFEDNRFFVLSLNQKHLELFQGLPYSLSEVELKGVSQSMDEALKLDETERQIQFHTKTADSRGGKRAAMYHGQGAGNDALEHKKNILEYFQIIDKELHGLLRGENRPLIIAGVDYLLPIYKEANSYPHLMEEGISGNTEGISLNDLHKRAWAILQPYFQKAKMEAFSQYRQLSDTDRASHNLEVIVKSAHYDQIDSLFITLGLEIWGIFDHNTNEVKIHQEMRPGDEDLLDLAAVQVLLHKGKIYEVKQEDMADHHIVAAIFRY